MLKKSLFAVSSLWKNLLKSEKIKESCVSNQSYFKEQDIWL